MPTPTPFPIPRAFDARRRPITHDRPRLLGSAQYLQNLARQRPEAYKHMVDSARSTQRFDGGHEYEAKTIGLGVAYIVEADKPAGRAAVDLVLKRCIDRPIRKGH